MIAHPTENEYAPYYGKYVSLITESDLLPVLHAQVDELKRIAAAVSPDREQYRYAPGKWSIREVAGHVIDGERVFGYRAFALSRGEIAPLPSFDENQYVARSRYNEYILSDLCDEFAAIRRSNIAYLERLDDDELKRMGTVSGKQASARAVVYIMAGHVRHHLNGLLSSYGLSAGIR
jgi:hypothetical protein